ncbi:MAG: class II fructose-bisphosphate aldolase [Lachnospiraceae bacterium]
MVNEGECKTDPDMVAEYVSKTECDLLAVSVGNVHGLCLNPQRTFRCWKKSIRYRKCHWCCMADPGFQKKLYGKSKKAWID